MPDAVAVLCVQLLHRVFLLEKVLCKCVENGVLFYEIISELAKIMQNDLNYSLLTLSV